MASDRRPIVLYDSDCGFCRWSLGLILAWDRGRQLRPVAIDSAEGAELLADLSREAREGSWHFVGRAGERCSAGAAAPSLLRELPGGHPLAALSGRFPGATARGYNWVVRHRGALGKLVPAAARRRADRRIDRRR